MKTWTEEKALSVVRVVATINGKRISIDKKNVNKLTGLNTCSAVDYLVNHCGYMY
jgi:hypothetical protein